MQELHVCLWGKYNFKSYLPVVNSNGSDQILVLAPDNAKQNILNSLTFKSTDPLVFDWPDHPSQQDYSHLYDYLNQQEDTTIVFNLSAGDRLAAMSLYQFALQHNYPCYMIDEEDIQHWLPPTKTVPVEVDNEASLKFYFKAHQIAPQKSGLDMPITPELRQLTDHWANYSEDFPKFRTLNYLASTATPNSGDNIGTYTAYYSDNTKQLRHTLHDLSNIGLIQHDDKQVTFLSEAAKIFANGGWLELYTYDQIKALRSRLPQIQDVRLGLEILYPENIKNELDVVFLADNQLHLIEVKTSYLSNKSAEANGIVYKLEALSNALGVDVKGMVISLFQLPKSSLSRAGLYDIEVVSGQQITQLQYHLMKWIHD